MLLTVTKQPGTGTVGLTRKIEEALKNLQKDLPADVRISTDTFRQSRFIESSIGNVRTSLYEGAVFVVIVLFLFLADVRTTVISLVTLPLSLVTAVLVLHYMGLGINTMSLGGMAIAIGSLVDDAIVDVENVWKCLRRNRMCPADVRKPVLEVVFEASREVRMPVLNSTLIIVVSFFPLFFLSGMEGRMLVPLGIAFIVSLFASTVVALTLTPVLCSYLPGGTRAAGKRGRRTLAHAAGCGRSGDPKRPGLPDEAFVAVWLRRRYGRALIWALLHKRVMLGGAGGMLVLTLGLSFTLGHSFLPPFNEGSFTVNVSLMPGISLEESDRIGHQAEELLSGIPEVRTVARKTGRAELDEHALGVNVSEIEVPFEPGGRSHAEVLSDVRRRLSVIPGANIEIGQPISHRIDAMLSGTRANIAIKLFGDDLNRMFAIAGRIREEVAENVEGVADLNVEQQVERPELRIVPRRDMLAKYGISPAGFREAVTVNMMGEVVSQVYDRGKAFDLVVRAGDDSRGSMEDIKELMIDDADGNKVPLSYVADVVSAAGPNTINRENVQRRIVISANTDGRDLRSVVNDIRRCVDRNIRLPEGYRIEYGGQFESEQAASRILSLASVVSVVVIFLLLYMQFGNAVQSGVILLNLPLALIGGVFALFLTTGELSIPAIIGFISLFGIATRNGMLLVSHYNTMRSERKWSLRHVVIQGSLDRLNPILMTALSSALALIPLALRGDVPGKEIQSPMAKVILGGLLTSTFLNAFIVPVVYELTGRRTGGKLKIASK